MFENWADIDSLAQHFPFEPEELSNVSIEISRKCMPYDCDFFISEEFLNLRNFQTILPENFGIKNVDFFGCGYLYCCHEFFGCVEASPRHSTLSIYSY